MDKEESLYYQFIAAKKAKGISDSDFKYIVKATGSEAAAQRAVIGAPVSILRQMIAAQKEKEQPVKHTPPPIPTVPKSPTILPDDLPEIIKPSQINTNKITDTGTGGLSELELKMKQKGITDKDYDCLVSALGSKSLAKNAISYNDYYQLRKIIDEQKAKENTGLSDVSLFKRNGTRLYSDTGTSGKTRVELEMGVKSISKKDYEYLVDYFRGYKASADRAILNKQADELREMINEQRLKSLFGDSLGSFFSKSNEASSNGISSDKADTFVEDRNRTPKTYVPEIFQGNYDGNNGSIASMYYGIEADKTNDYPGDTDVYIDKNGLRKIKGLNINNKGCGIVATTMAIAAAGGYDEGTDYDHVKDATDFALAKGKYKGGTVYKDDKGTDIKTFVVDYAKSKGIDAFHTDNIFKAHNAVKNGDVAVVSIINQKGTEDEGLFSEYEGHIMTIADVNDDYTMEIHNPNRVGYNAMKDGTNNYTIDQVLNSLNAGFVVVRVPKNEIEKKIERFRQ